MRSFRILLASLLLAAAIALAGCMGSTVAPPGETAGQPGGTSGAPANEPSAGANDLTKPIGTPWVDSNVIGVIDDGSAQTVKDDYYVAIAKDWLSSAKIPDGSSDWGSFPERTKQLHREFLALIEDKSITDHDTVLLRNYYGLLDDWEARERAGVKPIEEAAAKIKAISTMDELTAYITSEDYLLGSGIVADDGSEAVRETLVAVNPRMKDEGAPGYRLYVGTNSFFSRGNPAAYDVDGEVVAEFNRPFETKALYMLKKLGYADAEAEKVVKDVESFEGTLYGSLSQSYDGAYDESGSGSATPEEAALQEEEYEASLTSMTLDELDRASGAFPIAQMLRAYGFGGADAYLVEDVGWLKKMGELYNERNLDAFKAHILCGLAIDSMPYLDFETQSLAEEMNAEEEALAEQALVLDGLGDGTADAGSGEGDGTGTGDGTGAGDASSEGEDPEDVVPEGKTSEVSYADVMKEANVATTIAELPGAATNSYVTNVYKTTTNDAARDLTNRVIAEYRDLINGQQWLDPETKAAAIEKLDAITVNVGYPSALGDTAALTITPASEGGTLYSATRSIRAYNHDLTLRLLADAAVDDYWQDPLDVNAYYNTLENVIYIGCGIIGGPFFDEGMSEEEKLAILGHTIAHEVSHAFDSSGAKYDKDGELRDWWTAGDVKEFDEAVKKVDDYFATIKPFGEDGYDGSQVDAEIIADMGGLRCVLDMAKDIEGFDYKKFFEAYVVGWESVGTMASTKELFYYDSHPLDATRANVTVQQVQEFYDTYGIKEGDPMYLAPEDRIAIWK